MSESEVRLLFIAEGMAMGAAAGLVGAALGSAVVHHYARVGIDFSEMMEKAGTDANISFNAVLYLQPSWPMVGLALAFGVVVSTLASLLPAAQAARLNPADAIRAQT
jgi:ABC-type lipoprotein release transport system permease subunit